MGRKIAIIQGHPDPEGKHFGQALADAYTAGAGEGGHQVRVIEVGKLDFPLLRRKPDWDSGEIPAALKSAQDAIGWADHLVILYPLWLGTMPALLKGFLEQVGRPGFAREAARGGKLGKKLLTGKSARIVVTMGMPALVYRWYFGAHGVKNLKRNILGYGGVAPIRESLVGSVETQGAARREKWLRTMHALGHSAS
jgi:putative NADPH-quinone reductase